MKRRYQSVMGNRKVAMLLFWAYIIPVLKAEARTMSLLEKEIEAKLKLLNKPAVKTIRSEDGDIIDCVNFFKQPAFDHPALKNHTVQRIPNFFRESRNASQPTVVVFQTWQKSGSCPKGTIPIRRILEEDLLRVTSIDRYGLKPPALFMNSTNTTILNFSSLNGSKIVLENRSGAHLATMGNNYIGAQAGINVWNPTVELPDDFTTAQIWLKAGNGFGFESVEAGWVVSTQTTSMSKLTAHTQTRVTPGVNPKLYGDNATRLFAYWTNDSYTSTGCFDLTCSGFVQTGTQVALGATIKPLSSNSGQQQDINVGMFKDDSGNWWLKVNYDIPIGYWPAELFNSLKQSAILVQWGGQVVSSRVKNSPHTGTGMGSGDFADGKFGHACFMRNVRIKDYSLQLKYPESVKVEAQEPNCYNALNDVNYVDGPIFYFGGPGRRLPNCP